MFVPYALILLGQKNLGQKDSVLLMRRAKTLSFGAGLYSLPGGKIEENESATQAAIREAHEELGVTIDPKDLEFIHIFNRKGKTERILAVIFRANNWQGVPINKEADKHDDLKWFPLDKLPENIIPAHKQALEQITQQVKYSEHGWQ